MTAITLLIFALGLSLVGVQLLNHRRLLKNTQLQFKESFIQVDLELQKRNAGVPELIEISKKYLLQERPLLEQLVHARNRATAALQKVTVNPLNCELIKELCLTEVEFQQAHTQFLMTASSNPLLMEQPKMIDLLKSATHSQNQIALAIESCNQSLSHYNQQREKFPFVLFSIILGFQTIALLDFSKKNN